MSEVVPIVGFVIAVALAGIVVMLGVNWWRQRGHSRRLDDRADMYGAGERPQHVSEL